MQLKADVNAIPGSSSVETVYQQILKDISEAEKFLNVDKWEEGKNYRFNYPSAKALRARVLLYMGNWQAAYNEATATLELRNELEDMNTSSTLPNSYKSVESIVALERFSSNMYTVISAPPSSFISLYRSGDQRRTKFYKRVTSSTYTLLKGGSDDFSSSFRTSEIYLIAAEAAARSPQGPGQR